MAAAAGRLMACGACGVLVTLEGRGSLLLLGKEEQGVKQAAGAAQRRCVARDGGYCGGGKRDGPWGQGRWVWGRMGQPAAAEQGGAGLGDWSRLAQVAPGTGCVLGLLVRVGITPPGCGVVTFTEGVRRGPCWLKAAAGGGGGRGSGRGSLPQLCAQGKCLWAWRTVCWLMTAVLCTHGLGGGD